MSTARERASVARTRHRKIGEELYLRQAPAIRDGAVKAAMISWCVRKESEAGYAAWRMLGMAILQPRLGASLLVSVGGEVGFDSAAKVAGWLRWHRRRKQFGMQDLQTCKKRSAFRALWNTVRRGAGVRCEGGGSGTKRALDALSADATVQLCALQLDGAIRCGVGRTPLHAHGELPAAPRMPGRILPREWVPHHLATMAERELGRALVKSRPAELPRRSFQVAWDLQYLQAELASLGGFKVLKAAKLLAILQKRQGVEGGREAKLGDVKANTLVASRLTTLVAVRIGAEGKVVAEVLTAQDWATMMGVPLQEEHPIRCGLRAVSESAAKGIVGQAVHVDVARCLVRAVCGQMDWFSKDRPVTYASLMSGVDFTAAAMEQVFGDRFTFVLASESNAIVAKALLAAWGSRLRHFTYNALGTDTMEVLGTVSHSLDVLMISFRCAPWSKANTLPFRGDRRRSQLERALEENQVLLRMARMARPSVILIECVAGMEQRQLRQQWGRLQGMILALAAWSWSRQVICPRETLGGYTPRRRVWMVGLLQC